MKDRLRRLTSRILFGSGMVAVGRNVFPKRGAVILYGHRVTGDNEGYLEGLRPDRLDSQLGYLTRHYEVISLSDLLACYEERRRVPSKSVVLTFDDGFRDNVENALPILKRHHVPATVFLVTGSVENGELPWPQRLGFLFQRTRVVEFACSVTVGQSFVLSNARARRRAYNAVKEQMKYMPREHREHVLEELAMVLEVESPTDRMLTWDQVRSARASGMEFGAHTYSHPHLARISFEEARWEIERSLDDFRDKLGIVRPSFCFPAGNLNSRLAEVVRSLGFRSAFQPDSSRRPNTLENADQFSLRRFGMPNGTQVELAAELDGPLNAIRSVVHRLPKLEGS